MLQRSGEHALQSLLFLMREVPSVGVPQCKPLDLSLLTANDEGVFYGVREKEGFRIVSPVQLFLDLYSAGKASKDLAQRLLEIIRARWHRAEPSSR